jgi:hypothetical protein
MKLDADVALFAKCLKNECDQEFRQVQEYVKDQVYVAVRCIVREKYNMKTEGEIMNILEMLKNNTMKLERWVWKKTLSKLYNQEEKVKIEQRIIEFIKT